MEERVVDVGSGGVEYSRCTVGVRPVREIPPPEIESSYLSYHSSESMACEGPLMTLFEVAHISTHRYLGRRATEMGPTVELIAALTISQSFVAVFASR